MKKILSIIPLIAFAAALNAAEVVVTPTSSTRQSIVVPEHTSDADTLTLNSTNFGSYTVGSEVTTTYASVRAIKGEGSGSANFAMGTLIIDADTEEANYTALSAASWTHNLFTLNFKNLKIELDAHRRQFRQQSEHFQRFDGSRPKAVYCF